MITTENFLTTLPSVPTLAQLSIRRILIAQSLKGTEAELIAQQNLGRNLALVCDANTYTALGQRIEQAVTTHTVIKLPGTPYPDERTVEYIRHATATADALIAVGSGTINDLCKYASFLDRKPYLIFPTAPSMNGYTSASAAITISGHKKSIAAHLPHAVFCDLSVMASAPARLIQSGLGDSLCRPTAQADWLLSHLLLGTPYDEMPYRLLTPYENELFAQSHTLRQGNLSAIELLTKTLLVSGLGMVIAGGSYPASQGEHLIAHTMEMVFGGQLPQSYHGEQIGITTLTMSKLQRGLLESPPKLASHYDQAAIDTFFGSEVGHEVRTAYAPKLFSITQLKELNKSISTRWPEIQEKIAAVHVPHTLLEETLRKAGAPMLPQDIGWPSADYEAAIAHAHLIRDRFTFLDLAALSDYHQSVSS